MRNMILDEAALKPSVRLVLEAKQLQDQSARLCAAHSAISGQLAVPCLKRDGQWSPNSNFKRARELK